ncbi:MAG: hypothetical protein WD876_01285, partial [Candidatus Pacearchaeota archaeon]
NFVNPDLDVTRTGGFNGANQDLSPVADNQMPNQSSEFAEVERDRRRISSGADVEGKEKFSSNERLFNEQLLPRKKVGIGVLRGEKW